jgi:hypothetical protein
MEELLMELFEDSLIQVEVVEELSWWDRYWWTGETSL